MKSVVSVVKGKNTEKMVQEALDLIGGLESVVKPGDVVLLKPNVHGPHPAEDHITTDPQIVATMVKLCKKAKAKQVLVGEAPSLVGGTMYCYEISGIKEAVEGAGGKLVDLETDEYVTMKVPQGNILKTIDRPKTFATADKVISLPVMKTHHGAIFTGGLKNMMGTLNRAGKNFIHRAGLFESITDINKVRMPDLVVADMIVAMEGSGPIAGRSINVTPEGKKVVREIIGGILVPMGLVAASKDVVASDATCARIMGIDPGAVPYMWYAAQFGLGNIEAAQIEVKGVQVAEVARKFKLPPTTFEEFEDYVTVHSENACFACPAYLWMGLDNIRARGLLPKHTGVHIVMGPHDYIPDEWGTGKNLVLLGDCVYKWKHLGMFMGDCPARGGAAAIVMRDVSPEAVAKFREVQAQHPTPNEKKWNK